MVNLKTLSPLTIESDLKMSSFYVNVPVLSEKIYSTSARSSCN